jgi:hypothetical protein
MQVREVEPSPHTFSPHLHPYTRATTVPHVRQATPSPRGPDTFRTPPPPPPLPPSLPSTPPPPLPPPSQSRPAFQVREVEMSPHEPPVPPPPPVSHGVAHGSVAKKYG